MLFPGLCTRRIGGEVVKRLMMRLKIRPTIFVVVDDSSRRIGYLLSILHCRIPRTGVPRPGHAFFRQRIADGFFGLRWKRTRARVYLPGIVQRTLARISPSGIAP